MDATHILCTLALAKQIRGTQGLIRCAKRLRTKYPNFRTTCNRLAGHPNELQLTITIYIAQLEAQADKARTIDNLHDWHTFAEPYILEGIELHAETLEQGCALMSKTLEPCMISKALKESYNAISNGDNVR